MLLAPPPAHAAELLAWAFLAAWLLPIGRPLAGAALPRAIVVPALLYGTCALASWLGQAIIGAAGVDPLALPMFLLRAVPVEYLSSSTIERETTIALQTAAGLSLLFAALAIAAPVARTRRAAAYAVAAGAAVLALLSTGDVLRQWAEQGFGVAFLLRYVRGERFSLHLADLNAAGSQFVLGGLVAAAFAVAEPRRRAMWIAATVAILPALWLTGSRSAAIGAVLVGLVVIPLARGRFLVRAAISPAGMVAAPAAAAAIVVALVAVARQPADEGSAARSLRFRAQFLQTSVRMFASAPVLGVGIGRYPERSNAFMPEELRAVYGHENAHNYFAQQFAELGVIGGAAFLWLAIALLRHGWRAVRRQGAADAALVGLLAGSIAFLLTCVTGHPLLVPEVALPFWVAIGAIGAVPTSAPARGTSMRIAIAAAAIVVAGSVGTGALGYLRPSGRPPERGLFPAEPLADGTRVRMLDEHAVTYVQRFRGVLIVPVRAGDQAPGSAPAVVDLQVGGWKRGTWELPPGRWIEIEVPFERRGLLRYRRMDVRVRQSKAVMMAAHRWRPLP